MQCPSSMLFRERPQPPKSIGLSWHCHSTSCTKDFSTQFPSSEFYRKLLSVVPVLIFDLTEGI